MLHNPVLHIFEFLISAPEIIASYKAFSKSALQDKKTNNPSLTLYHCISMGIKGLNSVITEHAPRAIKKSDIKAFFGRKVAIDASMSLYQFLIAVRQADGTQLTDDSGETTSHLAGLFYRTLRMIDNGIKPCYVFDGKPPELKQHELAKRTARRADSERKLEEAASAAERNKQQRRLVKVSPQHNEEAKKLLKLMGIPYVNAPGEAEAQCAELACKGKVYAAASEDMDTLCYGTPYLLRHLTFSEAKKEPIVEIDIKEVLEGLALTQKQFVDLGIMLGCDYLPSIRGVGPVTALKLLREHGSLESIVKKFGDPETVQAMEASLSQANSNEKSIENSIESIAKRESNGEEQEEGNGNEEEVEENEEEEEETKNSSQDSKAKNQKARRIQIPQDWPFQSARDIFLKPNVIDANDVDLKWTAPQDEELVAYLCHEKRFSEDRVRAGIKRLHKGLKSGMQARLDGFFQVVRPANKANDSKKKGRVMKKR